MKCFEILNKRRHTQTIWWSHKPTRFPKEGNHHSETEGSYFMRSFYTASEAWNIAGCFRCTGLLIWFPSSLWAVSYRPISVTSITHPSHRPSLNYETPKAVWSVTLDAGSRISLWQGAATDGKQIRLDCELSLTTRGVWNASIQNEMTNDMPNEHLCWKPRKSLFFIKW